MKYLDSAVKSQPRQFISPDKIKVVSWIGTIIFSTLFFCLYIANVSGFPGYNADEAVYLAWYQRYYRDLITTHFVLFFMILASTIITCFSIFILQQTVRVLKLSNPHLKLSFCNAYVA